MIAPAPLRAFVERYALDHGIQDVSRGALLCAVSSLERCLDRPAWLTDLCPDTVNRWIADTIKGGLTARTVKGYRLSLVTLWRYAAELDLARAPCRVRKVKVPRKLPTAWSREELQRLLATCTALEGRIPRGPTRRADFYLAFVLVAYETGLRLGDLLAIRHADIASDGTLVVVAHKTQEVISCKLSREARSAIRRMRPNSPELFRMSKRGIQEGFKALLKRAKLTGSIKQLRRTGATWVEATRPGRGEASAYLGHRTPWLAETYYIDPRHLNRAKPRPPRIG